MPTYLDFEDKIAILENKIKDLEEAKSQMQSVNVDKEISSLTEKYNELLSKTYANLTPWQKVSVARHHDRPHALDYINNIITNFVPMCGDRLFGEDSAIIGGLGRFRGETCMILGIEKGNDLETRIKYNFGMPKPEGYRKAQRLMKLADRLNIPVITFVDTSGAYPGQEAEERGQGEAIAQSTATCLQISVPMINIIIGEGGSGGAIAIAAGDFVMMLEHSVYSVISPEGCASILWRNDKMASEAADRLCITAKELFKFKIIDKVIKEPVGGAHRNHEATYKEVSNNISDALIYLNTMDRKERKKKKQDKFLNIGRLI